MNAHLPTVCDTLARVDETIEASLAQVEQVWDTGGWRPEVLTEDLPAALRRRALHGGKRLRPRMCHWGWVSSLPGYGDSRAGYGDAPAPGDVEWDERSYEDLVTVAAALELFHLFALVHDDVMDRSDTRRGLPSAHVAAAQDHRTWDAVGDDTLFGDSVAILLGDLAFGEASALVARTPPDVQRLWRTMVVELVQGQLLDLTGAATRAAGVDRARLVARLKSGAYTIQRPLLLGAATAGAPPAVRAALSDYGRSLGEAFALRDDILGVWGDPSVTGKPVGDDLVAGKATVLIALGRERLSQSEIELLDRAAELSTEDVLLLQKALVTSGVRADVEALVESHVCAARVALAAAPLRPDAVESLGALAATVAWRDA